MALKYPKCSVMMTATGTNNMRFDNKMLWKGLFMQLSLHMNCDKFIEANAGVEFNIHLVTKTMTYYIRAR